MLTFEITFETLNQWMQENQSFHVVDIRHPSEKHLGSIPSSISFSEEQDLNVFVVEQKEAIPLILLCHEGKRSAKLAQEFRDDGRNVFSLKGGFRSWLEGKHPLCKEELGRYSRQMVLPEIGISGQIKLKQSKVLIVGLGGLGSPAALYLAGSGVGTLGLVDPDRVQLSNLHRQILHTPHSIGDLKTTSASHALHRQNPAIHVNTYPETFCADNAEQIARNYDLIVDGSDQYDARRVLNKVSLRLKIPWVHGSVNQFEGRVTAFDPRKKSACYSCLYPALPNDEALTCRAQGVLPTLPGVIGLIQANEAIKLLLGIGDTLVGRIFSLNLLKMETKTFTSARDPQCKACH